MAAGLCRTRCAFQLQRDTVRGGREHKMERGGEMGGGQLIDMLKNAVESRCLSRAEDDESMRRKGLKEGEKT